MLLGYLCFPFCIALFLHFFSNFLKSNSIRYISLISSFIIFIYSLVIWIGFSNMNLKFQFFNSFQWIYSLNLFCNFGVDGVSLFFLILTSFLFILCVLYNWVNTTSYLKELYIILFLIEFFLLLIFLSLDLFLFYFFFESILIPMFILINFWGGKAKKIKAAYYFFFYTLIGSLGFLFSIIYIYVTYGITSYPYLFLIKFTNTEQIWLWIGFFISFASKVPMIPFHIWLPEAHVEAPTTGSIILAGILLKLGIYGFLRFLIPLFPYSNIFYLPVIAALSIIGIIYSALTAIRQHDLKRIIAYSSISHMNLVVLGLFTATFTGIQGAILQSLSHGFVASGLFFCVGFLYDRYHSRLMFYYSGLVHLMPLFSIVFIFFTLGNIAIPGTSNFTGEFLLLLSIFKLNKFITFLSATGMILGGIYSLNLANKIIYGNLKTSYIQVYFDLTLREFVISIILCIFIFILGLYPNIILIDLSMTGWIL